MCYGSKPEEFSFSTQQRRNFPFGKKGTSFSMGTERISNVAELSECDVTLTNYTHRAATVRMSGCLPSVFHMPSQLAQ
jgi:hypothetical protein